MAKKTVIKHQVVDAPKNPEEAAMLLSAIGSVRRSVETIRTSLNEQIEALKATSLVQAKPLQDKLARLVEALYVFAEGQREALTDGGKRKTVALPTGSFGWRTAPPAVNIRSAEKVLASLKELGLTQFIRTKEEINKEAMLKEPEAAKSVKGVFFTQHEEFFVKPSEVDIPEVVSSVDKLKKAMA